MGQHSAQLPFGAILTEYGFIPITWRIISNLCVQLCSLYKVYVHSTYSYIRTFMQLLAVRIILAHQYILVCSDVCMYVLVYAVRT